MEEAGVQRASSVVVDNKVGTECVVEGLGGTVQAVECLLEGPHVFLSLIIERSEALWELEVDCLPDLCVQEGSKDVEAVQDHSLLGSEGQD